MASSRSRRQGEWFIESGTAYLCGGDHPSEWPAHGHLLSPSHDAHVRRLRGDDFVNGAVSGATAARKRLLSLGDAR